MKARGAWPRASRKPRASLAEASRKPSSRNPRASLTQASRKPRASLAEASRKPHASLTQASRKPHASLTGACAFVAPAAQAPAGEACAVGAPAVHASPELSRSLLRSSLRAPGMTVMWRDIPEEKGGGSKRAQSLLGFFVESTKKRSTLYEPQEMAVLVIESGRQGGLLETKTPGPPIPSLDW